MKLTKLLACALAFAAIPAMAAATDCTPKRVGPVSYYGALHTSGSKIIGEKNKEQAMLRGMSFFWADGTGGPYYKKEVIKWAAEELKVDVIRFAMGIEYYDSDGGTKNKIEGGDGYKSSTEGLLSLLDIVVGAAIENDIYVIVDWHSHRAHLETPLAKTFFETVSKKYKDVPNVIYEIYNEPVDGSGGNWSAVKNYANQICPIIRNSTQNLIIVGTPSWSQNPQQGASDPVNSTNIAYVLHFYAATHSKGAFGGNVEQALSKGYPVFISEWGTTGASGDGAPSTSATNEWTAFMDQKLIPNCNWSLRQQTSAVDNKSEQSAMFSGSKNLTTYNDLSSATYTTSGSLVKSYLTKNARSWADSLVKGKNTGSCAFPSVSEKQTVGQITGKLKSGCTYTSSNEAVAVAEGSNIIVKDYGYAIFTGNDGSQSVVSITQVAGQTITNFHDWTCAFSGTCKSDDGRDRLVDYDGDGTRELIITMENSTHEGSKFTLTALNPDIIGLENVTCINSCSNTQKNQKVWMFKMKKYGDAKFVASAPAITGYRAMQDTITVSYTKAATGFTKNFKDANIALGATITGFFSDTMARGGGKVTYTFNGQPTCPYLTRQGDDLVAGNQNAAIYIEAIGEESADYKGATKSASIIIGDANQVVNLEEFMRFIDPQPSDAIHNTVKVVSASISAQIAGGMLQFSNKKAGLIKVSTYDALGNRVMESSDIYNAGSHQISLEDLAHGSYMTVIQQNSQKATLRWNK